LRAAQDVLRKIEREGQVFQGRDRCRDAEVDYPTQCHGQDELLLARAKNEQRKELKNETFITKHHLTNTLSLVFPIASTGQGAF